MFKQALRKYSDKKKISSSSIPDLFNENIHCMMLPWPGRLSEWTANLISLAKGFMEAAVLASLTSNDFFFPLFICCKQLKSRSRKERSFINYESANFYTVLERFQKKFWILCSLCILFSHYFSPSFYISKFQAPSYEKVK